MCTFIHPFTAHLQPNSSNASPVFSVILCISSNVFMQEDTRARFAYMCARIALDLQPQVPRCNSFWIPSKNPKSMFETGKWVSVKVWWGTVPLSLFPHVSPLETKLVNVCGDQKKLISWMLHHVFFLSSLCWQEQPVKTWRLGIHDNSCLMETRSVRIWHQKSGCTFWSLDC